MTANANSFNSLPLRYRFWITIFAAPIIAIYAILILLAVTDDRGYMLTLWFENSVTFAILFFSACIQAKTKKYLLVGSLTAVGMTALSAALILPTRPISDVLPTLLHPATLAQTVAMPILSAILLLRFQRSAQLEEIRA